MGKSSREKDWVATPSVSKRKCPDWGVRLSIGEFVYKEGHPAYVENQVILTGREDQVNDVVREVLGFDLEQQEERPAPRIVLDRLPDEVLDRFPGDQAQPVVVEVVDTRGRPAAEVVSRMHENASQRPSPLSVFADLNFVTGHPHIVAGSPHIVAGSPLGVPGAAKKAFGDQWAFGSAPPGIGLTSLGPSLNTPGLKGQGVRVGVFDTSPFEADGAWEIPWMSPKLRLCVSHLLSPSPPQTTTSDHGLFVAGLVHAVAPQSDIHLIQVLNENAFGDLNTLNRALDLFIQQGSLTDTVVNLSLGFPQPQRPAAFGLEELRDSYMNLIQRLAEVRGTPDPWSYEDGGIPVVSLETILTSAISQGVTVVAAAGNESAPEHSLPPEIPAAYSSVIGVAASNKSSQRACFSNQGDLAAPGGDSDRKGGVCAKKLEKICEEGLIGPVLITSPGSGYACWVGTSFAAPLVSGLAARILSKGGPPGPVKAKLKFNKTDPEGSPLGDGIIDVLKSLST
jgi:subtilisin family serine protease